MSSNTIEVNDDTFNEKVIKSEVPVLVDFWAPWCGPCKSIAPTLEELAGEYQGKAAIAKINVDENANSAAEYGVRSIPFLAIFKNGKIVDQVAGAVPKTTLSDLIDKTL